MARFLSPENPRGALYKRAVHPWMHARPAPSIFWAQTPLEEARHVDTPIGRPLWWRAALRRQAGHGPRSTDADAEPVLRTCGPSSRVPMRAPDLDMAHRIRIRRRAFPCSAMPVAGTDEHAREDR